MNKQANIDCLKAKAQEEGVMALSYRIHYQFSTNIMNYDTP